MESKKWYGLTIPKKTSKVDIKRKSVFESDDSDDEAKNQQKVKKEPLMLSKNKKMRNPEKKTEESVDPRIYEYDSIYDEMKASEGQKTSHTKMEPRYITSLIKAADKRKRESERRVERKIQAERIKEGDAFKDKEAFVTSAYRQKMVEMEEEEERERRETALEEMMDSTKQNDLSGFYRHFFKQTVGEEKVPEFGERDLMISRAVKKEQGHSEASKSRQRSESPSGTRSEKRNSYGDVKKEERKSGKSNSSHLSESKHSAHNEIGNPRHSRDEVSSHKNKHRHRSNSLSDSESRKSKPSVEKSHRKKSDNSSHSSKHIYDEKTKSSSGSRNQEEKIHGSEKYSHSNETRRRISPSETHSSDRSLGRSGDSSAQKPKHLQDTEEHIKDTETHGKMGKRSLQRNSKSSADDQSCSNDKSVSRNINKEESFKSKHVSYDSHKYKAKEHSGSPSKKWESRDKLSENKRKKHDVDDDDDSLSSSSSGEDEVATKSNQKEDKVPEKPKTDMMTKFAKRTVGKVFDDAQTRYFKRRDAAKTMN